DALPISFKTIGSDISCNLGSLNVKRMLDLDNAKFDHIVETATRALDNVTRLTNLNSAPSIKAGNERSRSIGLGQMNLHGALAHNGLEYGSDEALELWDKYMSKVTRAAMHASALIARDRGSHSYFDGSEYDTGEWFDKKVTDRKSTRLNSSHVSISYAVFCLKKITETHKHE